MSWDTDPVMLLDVSSCLQLYNIKPRLSLLRRTEPWKIKKKFIGMLPTISLDVNTELRLDLILVCLHSHGAAVAWMKEMSNFLFVFNDVIFKKKQLSIFHMFVSALI